MNTSDKLKLLFEAAMLEPEPTASPRLVPLPRNPNGSVNRSEEPSIVDDDPAESFDPRQEMLARVNRMKEILAKD